MNLPSIPPTIIIIESTVAAESQLVKSGNLEGAAAASAANAQA